MELQDFKVGYRVELHPATDAWMMGDRFGWVTKIGRKYLHVDCDSGRVRRIHPANIGRIVWVNDQIVSR